MEDTRTSEEDDDIDSQDSNIPIDHGHLARNCSIKIITPAVKAIHTNCYNIMIFLLCILQHDYLLGIVVSMSDCHPRGPGFDSRLYPRNFSGSVGSGTGSTQPREDNLRSYLI